MLHGALAIIKRSTRSIYIYKIERYCKVPYLIHYTGKSRGSELTGIYLIFEFSVFLVALDQA